MAINNDFKNTIKDNNVYLQTSIDDDKCADVIAGLTQFEQKTISKQQSSTIIAPYDNFSDDQTILNVYITSDGGDGLVARAIIELFNRLQAKGVIIRTHNLSYAASAASLIAVSGTPGYRYMAHDAYNLIHYGKHVIVLNHENELPYAIKNEKKQTQSSYNIYLSNTISIFQNYFCIRTCKTWNKNSAI